ncbi:enoyl-CoA hydratase/isomerase family protein [Arenicella xantha]|uniref:Methylglutaconyl-CoA hydratase n=1 Tax=Arenicella xantha TaxID=644221 RepID=A0A395JMY4_9GAMM|nr:enoyl-CoA hydratase/isomerase family protein [Arenicella xantha]RBP53024.1 methylglutaconyl-CoA hydratase [Arenicella xantha]
MSQNIQLDSDARGVATVTLNRAEKHNAFDDQIILELTELFVQLDADPTIRVVILAAAGKSFSAGADLAWMQRMASYTESENLADAKALATMLHRLNSLSKPTIAKVQGAAFGGAVGLVSCCDMAIASEHASFCLSEVKIGLLPATIAPYVIQAIGQRAARRYFLTAERFSASTATQLGLVSSTVSADQLDAHVEQLVETLLANSPAALAASKCLIDEVSNRSIDDALMNNTSARIAAIRVSPEGQEGLTAFLEKRSPNWLPK